MKTVWINWKRYKISSCWNDVSILQFHLLNNNHKFKDYEHDLTEAETLDLAMWQLSCLSNIPINVMENMTLTRFNKLHNKLKFIQKMPKIENISNFKFNGVKYEIIDPFVEDTIGKYITIEQLILKNEEILDSINKNEFHNYPYVIACLVHPVGGIYSDADIEERTKLFKNLDVVTAIGIVQFFFTKLKKLENILRQFSDQIMIQPSMKKTST